MKVKVIKAGLPTYWYANKIGEEFEVNKERYGYLPINSNNSKYGESGYFFHFEDVEIIKDMKKYTKNEILQQKLGVIFQTSEQSQKIAKFLGYDGEFKLGSVTGCIFMNNSLNFPEWDSNIDWLKKENYITRAIEFGQVDFGNEKITGFKLIKEYPGSKKLGYFERFTTGEFLKYPEYWQPVYQEQTKEIEINYKKENTHPNIMESGKVTIGKNLIKFGGINTTINFLKELVEDMEDNNFTDQPTIYKTIFPFVKIGCSTFSLETIKTVINEYNKFNS